MLTYVCVSNKRNGRNNDKKKFNLNNKTERMKNFMMMRMNEKNLLTIKTEEQNKDKTQCCRQADENYVHTHIYSTVK
jgi:hypothetical protein